MSNEQIGLDLDQAMLDPTSVFAGPEDVVTNEKITDAQKVEILRRWGYDALELEVAEEENMTGGEPDLLDRVVKALEAMGVEPDIKHRPPTKQGSI